MRSFMVARPSHEIRGLQMDEQQPAQQIADNLALLVKAVETQNKLLRRIAAQLREKG